MSVALKVIVALLILYSVLLRSADVGMSFEVLQDLLSTLSANVPRLQKYRVQNI